MSEVRDKPAGWDLYTEYQSEVKKQNRFFPNEKFLRLFNLIIHNDYNLKTIPEGKVLYRARKNEPGREFEFISELGANKENPLHNRASPIGIPYIYLAEDPETAIAEVRANVKDAITVATFKTTRELSFLHLDQASVFSGDCGEFDGLEVASFIFFLSLAFATPIQKQAEIEYLPTQYFAEYCKSRGLDGIRYISSARGFRNYGCGETHSNYVLFDDANTSYCEAHRYKVEDIQYKIKKECLVPLKDEGKM